MRRVYCHCVHGARWKGAIKTAPLQKLFLLIKDFKEICLRCKNVQSVKRSPFKSAVLLPVFKI